MATHVDVGNTEDSTLVGLPREQMDDVESGQATGGASSVGSDTGLTADSARQVHVTAAGKPRAGRYCCANVGNSILICGPHPSKSTCPRKCLVGPDWPCMLYTYALIVVPNVCALLFLYPGVHIAFTIIAACCFAATFASFSLAALTDPGIVPRGKPPTDGQHRPGNYCRTCHVYRRSGTLHCSDCDACVEELDHHCPWTGKCIGKRNLTFFYMFLGTLSLNIIYTMIILFVQLAMNRPASSASQ